MKFPKFFHIGNKHVLHPARFSSSKQSIKSKRNNSGLNAATGNQIMIIHLAFKRKQQETEKQFDALKSRNKIHASSY
jgi:hypothetical protein